MPFSAHDLKQKAYELGFNMVGITPAKPSPTLWAYENWVEREMYGHMTFMAREDRLLRRRNLQTILKGAQSLIVVGVDYGQFLADETILTDPTRGRIARYAWGLDYHEIIAPKLETLAEWIREAWHEPITDKVYVDTGAILERSHAQQAGMGFIGKNTMLINPKRGSTFFIGEIITTIDFDQYDQAGRETMCGTCSRCLNACPTDAFPQPHILDARQCISYHTIENRGWIDLPLRSKFGNWVFGCDICQDICPFQRFSQPTQETLFISDDLLKIAPPISDLLSLTDETFQAIYRGSPVERIKRRGLVRNACIAAGNSHNARYIPYIIQLLYDPEKLIRGHAAWALWQLGGNQYIRQIQALYDRDEPEVRGQIEAFLSIKPNKKMD